MNKARYIELHGEEAYKEYRHKCNERWKERIRIDIEFRSRVYKQKSKYGMNHYNNDTMYRNLHKFESARNRQKKFVINGMIELIENYDLAKADNFKGWDIHHKLEIHDDYINSKEELIMMNLYYNRPPEELIWLKRGEHQILHNISKRKKEKNNE